MNWNSVALPAFKGGKITTAMVMEFGQNNVCALYDAHHP
jgi:hypothetical protein